MTRLNRSQMLGGFQGLDINTKFDVDASSFGGGNGGNAIGFVPSGSFHYVHSTTDRFKLGISIASYAGLGLDYDDTWAGRYYVQNASLLTFSANPGAAYRVNDWLSVGAGAVVMYGEVDMETAINNSVTDPGTPDGQIKAKDDDVGYGYNLGLLLEPTEALRFGITYRSDIDLDFKDVMSSTGLGQNLERLLNRTGLPGSKVDLSLTIPQAVMVSGYYQLNPCWALMANVGWQDWSRFGMPELAIHSTTSVSGTADLDYEDTYHVALGAHYRINPQWLWMAGIAYDSSPLKKKNRSPVLPLDRTVRYATGAQYEWSENITVGGAYEFIDLGDAAINTSRGPLSGDLKGEYDTNYANVVALYVIYTF